jgi:hypothetical protein
MKPHTYAGKIEKDLYDFEIDESRDANMHGKSPEIYRMTVHYLSNKRGHKYSIKKDVHGKTTVKRLA